MMPGEALAASGASVETDDIWTLAQRTMLLFHVCLRMREDVTLGAADRAQLAVQAWHRIEDLERRLDRHTCELDNSFGFQSKELLFRCVCPPLRPSLPVPRLRGVRERAR